MPTLLLMCQCRDESWFIDLPAMESANGRVDGLAQADRERVAGAVHDFKMVTLYRDRDGEQPGEVVYREMGLDKWKKPEVKGGEAGEGGTPTGDGRFSAAAAGGGNRSGARGG